jgi:hypothetical protein
MKTREEMIYELTEHELNYLFDMNGDLEDSVCFFAKGGFYAYTDEALFKQWTFQFTDNYPQGETK